MDLERLDALAGAWADALARWAIPEPILAGAESSPWFCDPEHYRVDSATARDVVGVRLAAEVLPPTGGRVLDVGCGAGRASVPLVPPATRLVGVDTRAEMLAAYTVAGAEAGANVMTIAGAWPEVAADTPVCDVAVCQHVIYNVADIVPFLVALTDRARLAVVLVLPEQHPMTNWNDAWMHFWQLDRPTTPVADDVIAILRELDEDPEVVRFAPELPSVGATPELVDAARRRLCLPPDRSGDVADYLAHHPVGYPPAYVALRWPGRG